MKYTCQKFIDDFDSLFSMMFSDEQFDKYQGFFDVLIEEHHIDYIPYQETDTFINKASKMLDCPSEISKFYLALDCRSMFDFYYRYYILATYIQKNGYVILRHNKTAFQFSELFTISWVMCKKALANT